MIWFILGVIGFIVFLIWFIKEEWEYCYCGDRAFAIITSLLIAFLISLICFFMSSIIISEFAELDYKETNDTKIIALKDNQNINGRFYIMGGYVDEEMYYYYAEETELGYKTEKVKAENSYIKYTDEEPHIKAYEAEFKNDYVYLFAACVADKRYVIHCPENTITTEYVVDLE